MHVRPRDLTTRLEHALTTDRVVALMGARQAGKTTLVHHLLRTEREPLHYNLKDAAIRRHLATQARRDFRQNADRLIVLDEVQQSPDLLGLVQVVVDERPRVQGQFLLLGSNHLLLNRQIKESLAGRVALFTLEPLSFAEWSGRGDESLLRRLLRCDSPAAAAAQLGDFHLAAADAAEVAAAWQEFTVFGGFPEFLTRRDADDRRRWLRDYHQTYLETDLRDLVQLRNPESFEVFERLIAVRAGSLVNLSEVAGEAGLAVDTIRRFLEYYRQLFVAWRCLPYHRNLASRVRKSPKWYFSDVGILRTLLDNWRSDDGHLFENCVMTELRKGIYLETMRRDMSFLRTSAGAEIDAVFATREGRPTFLAEIKIGTTVRNSDWRTLARFVADSPDHVGLVIANTPGIEMLAERVWSLPAAWLLG
jgi:uncharacterized protein